VIGALITMAVLLILQPIERGIEKRVQHDKRVED
jgi:hypothetical protein